MSRNCDIIDQIIDDKPVNKEDSSPSLGCERCPKAEIFIEMSRAKLWSLVWSPGVGGGGGGKGTPIYVYGLYRYVVFAFPLNRVSFFGFGP